MDVLVLPFDRRQFFDLFEAYNAAIWPAQPIAAALALLVVALIGRGRAASRVVAAILALGWGWTGIVYHQMFFSTINPAAPLFSVIFVGEALLLASVGVFRGGLDFAWRRDASSFAALALIAYPIVLYPIMGFVAGETWPRLPAFGVTPCPLTLFAAGVLMLSRRPLPYLLLVAPLIWSLIGTAAAILLSVPQDAALLLAATGLLKRLRSV